MRKFFTQDIPLLFSHPFKFLKRFLPLSFWGRSLLIVIAPVVCVQLISGYVFFHRHFEETTQFLSRGLAGQIALSLQLLENTHLRNYNACCLFIFEKTGLTIQKIQDNFQELPTPRSKPFQSRLERALRRQIGYPHKIQITSQNVMIWIQAPQNVFYISFPRKYLFSPTTPLWLFWSLGASFFFVLIASFILRRQIRPLQQLALVLEDIEDPHVLQTYRVQGPSEIRRIGELSLLLQKRLMANAAERSTFLAGISHDLRTPLTRIHLQLALMSPSADRDALQEDVDQLIHMVEDYLTFLSQETLEQPTSIQVAIFLHMILKHFAPLEKKVLISIPPSLTFRTSAPTLRRCLQNLLENALRYSKTTVQISASQSKTAFHLSVEDDGPGISTNDYDAVFKPFVRLDPGRNLKTGGTGLGLTIVEKLMTQTGGTVSLGKSILGGLCVTLSFPKPAPPVNF